MVEEYADDGYTGTNFERPGFKRMIQYRFDQEIRNVLEYCSSVPAAETEESAV